jgi:steroid delta-isomerase-like uncharacterized protein
MAKRPQSFPYARYTEEVWNSHNPDALAAFVAPDARVHSMTPGSVAGTGLDYLKGRAQSLLKAFPDVHFVIEDVVERDGLLAARVTLEGTQRGEFAGIPATGKRMKVYDFAMYRIEEGKITDVWSLIDMQALREQLGAAGTARASGQFR